MSKPSEEGDTGASSAGEHASARGGADHASNRGVGDHAESDSPAGSDSETDSDVVADTRDHPKSETDKHAVAGDLADTGNDNTADSDNQADSESDTPPDTDTDTADAAATADSETEKHTETDTDTDTDTEKHADTDTDTDEVGGDGDAASEVGGPEGAEGAEGAAGQPRRLAAVRHRLGRKRWWVPISVVVLVALVAGAFYVGRGSSNSHQNKPSTVPAGFATYRSPDGGFSISYPAQWQVVPNTGVSLLLSAGGNDALSIREVTLQQAVDTKNVDSIRAVTDAILSTPSAQLQVLLARPITIGGIAGYYYLYTFPSGKDRGVHAHYFLFQGRKLTMLVFQALPSSDFQGLAPVFDQVSATFRSDPKVLGPPPAPATTAPGSPAPTTAPPAGGPTTAAPPTTAPATTAPATTVPGPTAPAPTTPGSTP